MADQGELVQLDLRAKNDRSEREDLFWNTSTVEMKFSVEKVWIKSVRKAKNKPNYGMGEMDSLHEEVCGNKLELSGPLVDSYLRELGESLKHKQTHSKATGLTNPTTLFIPWMVFRHIMTLARGYGCEVDLSGKGKKVEILIKKQASARKIFCPSRFSGQNYIHKRKFKKQTDGKYHYAGRSSVVVTKNTPITLRYNITTNRLTLSAFIQRYNEEDFAIDNQIQKLMNIE